MIHTSSAEQNLAFELRYTGIQVRNLDLSLEFYTKILGMRMVSRIKVPETKGEFAIVRCDGCDHYLELNWYENQEYRSGDELDHIAFEVEDLSHALAELAEKGVKPVSYTRESPRSRWTYISDPNGIWIELFQRTYGR